MTDNELRLIMKQSQEAGFRKLFDEYYAYVFAICANKLKNCGTTEDVDECISDTFAAVFRYLKGRNGQDGELKGIIGTIAKRTSIDCFRKLTAQSSRIRQVAQEELGRLPDDSHIEDSAEQSILNDRILDCISELGEPDSSIIVYFYYYGIKTHKIASLLGMSSSNVQQRLSRARKKLKKLLSEAGINEEGYL